MNAWLLGAVVDTVLFGLGALAFIHGVRELLRGKRSASWPVVPAVLLKLSFVKNRGSNGTSFGVSVTYSYAVAGTAYQSDLLTIGYAYSGDERFQDSVYEKVANLRPFVVRVDPSDPAFSVIFPPDNSFSGGMLAVGVFILVFASIFGLVLLAFTDWGYRWLASMS